MRADPLATAPGFAPRSRRLAHLSESRGFDVVVIGGGITGAGCALDLAQRGLRVLLVERGDWAGATSSASSKLVHGGLRYLERFEIGLVRESCLERGLMLSNAPELVQPEPFVWPVRKGDRVSRWKLAAGLWLYAALAVPRSLGRPRLRSRAELAERVPGLDPRAIGGGEYLDARTDDARLTLAVALAADRAGALCISRVEAEAIEPGAAGCRVALRDAIGGTRFAVDAACALLAGGPATDELRGRAGLRGGMLSVTRGTHAVLARERLPLAASVVFPSAVDGRVMFLLRMDEHVAIGTTDVDADPALPCEPTRDEIHYLLDSANEVVPGAALRESDVACAYAGLRPLLAAPADRPSDRSRDERAVVDGRVVTIAGGKLTTWRAMAERAADRVVDVVGRGARASGTRTTKLPPPPLVETAELADDALAAAALERSIAEFDCMAPSDFLLRRTHGAFAAAPLFDRLLALCNARMPGHESDVAALNRLRDGGRGVTGARSGR